MTYLAPCGTPTAYKRHLRHGEPACDACRTANSAAVRRRKQTRETNLCTSGRPWRRNDLLDEWAELRDVVSFDAFPAHVGMTFAAWERAYQRARVAGDPRAVGRRQRVAS